MSRHIEKWMVRNVDTYADENGIVDTEALQRGCRVAVGMSSYEMAAEIAEWYERREGVAS